MARWARCVALACLAGLVSLVGAAFIVETGSLTIEPSAWKSAASTLPVSVANFGRTVYGGELRCADGGACAAVSWDTDARPLRSGELVYLTGAAGADAFGCQPLSARARGGRSARRTRRGASTAVSLTRPLARQSKYTASTLGLPIIAILDRGAPAGQDACPFASKTLRAQQAGAAAVIIVDNRDEGLLTMDGGVDDDSQIMEAQITIPSVFVTRQNGIPLEAALRLGNQVVGTLSWVDIVPHASPVVSLEFWSNSNDECGVKCTRQQQFIRDFTPAATALMQTGALRFTPHYITMTCGAAAAGSDFCTAQCTNGGRYCQQDPDGDLTKGFSGADVVRLNLRSLCVFQVANASGTPWAWWTYQNTLEAECSMATGDYSAECAASASRAIGVSTRQIAGCMGNTADDVPNAVLEAERKGLVSDGTRGDISFFPTLIANGIQYRGDINNVSVLEFVCSAYPPTDVPPLCASVPGLITTPCREGKQGYASCAARADGQSRCVDDVVHPFFRCTCPSGSTLAANADGSQSCATAASGSCARAAIQLPATCGCPTCVCRTMPGSAPPVCSNVTTDECAAGTSGCWAAKGLSACVRDLAPKRAAALLGADPASVRGYTCACPPGTTGDGVASCADIDECAARGAGGATVCPGAHALCVNTFGSYACLCAAGYALDASRTCVAVAAGGGAGAKGKDGLGGGAVFAIVFFTLLAFSGAVYGLYRWKLKKHLETEVRDLMSNYLPLQHADTDFKPLPGHPDDVPL